MMQSLSSELKEGAKNAWLQKHCKSTAKALLLHF